MRTLIALTLALLTHTVNAQQNPIITENQKPGSTDWTLTNTQIDESINRSPAIEGYASQLSYAAGDTLTLHVSTNPPTGYNIDIYRTGYYNGDGARKVLAIQNLVGSTQPEPLTGPRNLKYCDWSPSFTTPIPEEWLSGVYLAKLSTQDDGPQSYIIFTIRDDRQADLVFQVSDFTWHTYNRWPAWNSLYDLGDNQWETRTSNHIGFQRPYGRYHNELPLKHEQANKVIGSGEYLMWEFQLAYFLEREGYNVTYISNLDTHQHPHLLTRAKAFLSVGHDEYWTRTMFNNVAAARDTGVDLIFLSGNTLSGELTITSAPDGTPDNVIARNRHFPDEQNLMGASSYGVGLTDFTVTDDTHWLYENTGMKNGDTVADLIGWEYHGPPLRDDPTLKILAQGAVRGMNNEAINRNYTTLIYDGPLDNFIFNAATCWWSLPLSTPPGTVPSARGDFSEEDPRVQQMTRNLLNRAIGRNNIDED